MSETWAEIVLSSFAEAGEDGIVHAKGEVDWQGAWRTFCAGLNAKARLGAKLGMLIAFTAPIWVSGRLRSLAALPGEMRAHTLDGLLQHRLYLVRELALMLKLCACMALFRVAAVRARTNYDAPQSSKRRLPTLSPQTANDQLQEDRV